MPLEVRPAVALVDGKEFFGSVVMKGAALQFGESFSDCATPNVRAIAVRA
jgi:hypothetical protein